MPGYGFPLGGFTPAIGSATPGAGGLSLTLLAFEKTVPATGVLVVPDDSAIPVCIVVTDAVSGLPVRAQTVRVWLNDPAAGADVPRPGGGGSTGLLAAEAEPGRYRVTFPHGVPPTESATNVRAVVAGGTAAQQTVRGAIWPSPAAR